MKLLKMSSERQVKGELGPRFTNPDIVETA